MKIWSYCHFKEWMSGSYIACIIQFSYGCHYLLMHMCTTQIEKFFLDQESWSKTGHASFCGRKIVKEKLVDLCRTHEQIGPVR